MTPSTPTARRAALSCLVILTATACLPSGDGGADEDARPDTGGWSDQGVSDVGTIDDGGPMPDGWAPDGAAPDMAAAPIAAWDLESNLIINGVAIDEAARSVVAHRTPDGMVLKLTDYAAFCPALEADACPGGGSLLLTIGVAGVEPGVYAVGADASVYVGDLTAQCVGAGLGFDSGTITVRDVDLEPGGAVAIELDVEMGFTGQRLSGTITAPECHGADVESPR